MSLLLKVFQVPLQTSILLTSSLVGICIFTTTFPQHTASLRWIRFGLAFPTLLVASAVAYPPDVLSKPAIYVETLCLGAYLFARVVDVCIVGFWEEREALPRLLMLKEKLDDKGEVNLESVVLPLPTTLQGRLAYTVDNLFSMRGASSFKDRSWDWAMKSIREYRPASRMEFFRVEVKRFILTYLAMDILEYYLYNYPWNLQIPNPVTSLPAIQQVAFTLLLFCFVYLGTSFGFLSINLVLVALGLPPSSCPPLYSDNPLPTQSLAEYWSLRWHSAFRRMFERGSLPVVWMLKRKDGTGYFGSRTTKFIRAFAIFTLSAIFHLAIGNSIPRTAENGHLSNIEPVQVKFFLAQPFGLLFEIIVLKPMTESLPVMWKAWVRRVWLWSWMIWTGRWFCDGWVVYGHLGARGLDFSPVELFMAWRKV
ncbi:hypothetical protein FRB96_008444 [Tulasnella sp. 330]|nr:hypothetical protein FRB96_008444 [Tulasnella sp. 330]KAG8872301.1 hypothetical protein FRB97_007776 [Tulasnella sp. 331]